MAVSRHTVGCTRVDCITRSDVDRQAPQNDVGTCKIATGWFKHKIPNYFRVQCPRLFWEIGPEMLHTCSMCPCRAFHEWGSFVFLFFRQMFDFFYFWGYLGLKGSHFSSEIKQKNKKKHAYKARQVNIEHVCKILGSISQKRRRHFDFCAINCKNNSLASWLRGVRVYSNSGVKFDLIVVLRSHFFEYWHFVQPCLGAPGNGSSK